MKKLKKTWMKAYKEQRKTGIVATDLYKSLPNQPIYLNDQLSAYYKKLLNDTKIYAQKNNYKFVWVSSGEIFMRRDENAKFLKIRNYNDLHCLFLSVEIFKKMHMLQNITTRQVIKKQPIINDLSVNHKYFELSGLKISKGTVVPKQGPGN